MSYKSSTVRMLSTGTDGSDLEPFVLDHEGPAHEDLDSLERWKAKKTEESKKRDLQIAIKDGTTQST